MPFAEDHCYPDATWAEALVEAHQQSCAAVGPELINANPNTQIGRADFMLNFGKWAEPIESGSVDGCAWHNTSYKRDILLDYGDDLPRMLDVEGVLHQDLRAKGMGLFQESAAKAYHLNFALFRSYAYAHWVSGRQYGGGRSTDWSLFKRLLYAAGSPLIPLMRLRDVSGHLRRCSSEQRRMLGMLWALSAGILIASAAEALSYVAGPGDSSEQKFLMEFHRERHVPTSDLRALRTPDAPRPMERTN